MDPAADVAAGETLFDSDDRDAQPVRSAINNQDMPLGPRTTGFFGTDIEVEFLRPVVAGERIGRRGGGSCPARRRRRRSAGARS